jgi:hypothetical protein
MKNFTPEMYHSEIPAFSLSGGNFDTYVRIRRGFGTPVERAFFNHLSTSQNIAQKMNLDAKNKHPTNTS